MLVAATVLELCALGAQGPRSQRCEFLHDQIKKLSLGQRTKSKLGAFWKNMRTTTNIQ